jgi:enediyne polyketide synthase
LNRAIAIVGMACRYPDARSPEELWENVLAQRQAFRRIPRERMRIDDYCADDAAASDRSYSSMAAVITGWEFDRTKFRVSRSTYEAADIAHWLALDVAAAAVDDARGGGAVPQPEKSGVIVGNTLTGDTSRAAAMRLRWPYVRRVIDASLAAEGWTADRRAEWLESAERRFKKPFPEVGEETLAGALSNTIAGRICGHLAFGGCGFVVDGACCSSLLAVAQACSMLADGDLDFALAGGVDVSLDPFELIGFAKTQALARTRMYVYDERANGFLPGEGCGFAVLMRHDDAVDSGARIYATIRGWGISSDGEGGITRPEVEGQRRALDRAYRRAGVPAHTVGYFEGHGTGTAVGDAVEIAALQSLLDPSSGDARPAIGSVKANIGHTKAAAGIAGLLKATLAVSRGIIPPATACGKPHRDLVRLRIPRTAEPWQASTRRAGVSAFGFGGANVHVVLEHEGGVTNATSAVERLAASAQDVELFLLDGESEGSLAERARRLATLAETISFAEMSDLATHLFQELGGGRRRGAIVASTPDDLRSRALALSDGTADRESVFAGWPAKGSIALLFSGQAAPARVNAGAWERRFPDLHLERLWDAVPGDAAAETFERTDVAQPAIVASSLAALQFLSTMRVDASVAIGHSLGELTALYWSGAIGELDVLRLSAARGAIMQPLAGGAMAALAAPFDRVGPLLRDGVVIAAMNAADQTVVSGPAFAVASVCEAARMLGIAAVLLPVRSAFHSPQMAAAATQLREAVVSLNWCALQRRMISTVTGAPVQPHAEISSLLIEQLTSPVRFLEAFQAIEGEVDLFIEAGPGSLLSDLAARLTRKPVVSMDAAAESLSGLLHTAALLFTHVEDIDLDVLVRGRFTRRFESSPRFIASPCEQVEAAGDTRAPRPLPAAAPAAPEFVADDEPPELVFRRLIARRTDLSVERISASDRLLADLHLNSISVAHLVSELTHALTLPPLSDPTQFANATVGDVARAIEELRSTSGTRPAETLDRFVHGIDDWVRAFVPVCVPHPLDRDAGAQGSSNWQVIPDHPLPLVSELRRRLADIPREGVVAVIPDDDPHAAIELLLESARRAPAHGRVVFVQQSDVAGGFGRTLFLERGDLSVRVVNVPSFDARGARFVAAESEGRRAFAHAYYDCNGTRSEKLFRLHDVCAGSAWDRDDVLLVTGGGKGIAAETSLHIARTHGVRLALIGRSDPAADALLASSLERFRAAGVVFRYLRADVTDRAATAAAVAEAVAELGTVTAVLHGAGANSPRLIESLDVAAVFATLAPKVTGLANVLAALDAGRLKLLVALGSVIARTGLRGEADYALANEWLARAVERFSAANPACRAITIESSVWSGAGMGERLGRIDALRRDGIAALTVDEAVAVLDRLSVSGGSGSMLVVGRIGDPPTIRFESTELPLGRFLEHPRIVRHGVEIVADSRLTLHDDPYLSGHRFRGEPLLPAVLGIEAMVQAAVATTNGNAASSLRNVMLDRPVIVPDEGMTTLRVATLARGDGVTDVALRSSETEYAVDHFRMRCHAAPGAPLPDRVDVPAGDVGLDVERDLYGSLLFQRAPFQRVRRYLRLSSVECVAEIAVEPRQWFGRFLPQSLYCGDPGARDAAIHAIQACIPQATVLPFAIESIDRWATLPERGHILVFASERAREGDRFVYDLDLTAGDGTPIESWRGLALRAIERHSGTPRLAPSLWGPFLEREISPMFADTLRIAVTAGNRGTTESEAKRIGGIRMLRRGDGKPLSAGGSPRLSASHAGDVHIIVTSPFDIAVDLQEITAGPWDSLLDPSANAVARTIAAERAEPFATAATRIWGTRECGKKLGARADAPIILREHGDAVVRLQCGDRDVLSTILQTPDGTAIAVTLARSQSLEMRNTA